MLQFRELSAPTLKELFIRELENMILSGKLKVGEKLPSERDLSETMKVSRSVVNAGLVDMANKGFVEIIPRSGTYIADYRRYGKVETLVSILNYNGGNFSFQDVKSMLELRSALKKLAATLSIGRLTEENLCALEGYGDVIRSSHDLQEISIAAIHFDHDLCFFSGNTLLPLIISSFRIPYKTLMDRYFAKEGVRDLYGSLTDNLCACLRAGDLNRALDSIEAGTQDAITRSPVDTWYNLYK